MRPGISWKNDCTQCASTYRHSVGSALGAAFGFIGQISYNSVHMLYRMVTLEASTKNLSGPVTIARASTPLVREHLPRTYEPQTARRPDLRGALTI